MCFKPVLMKFINKISWRELFPTNFSLYIFVIYILLFVNQGILVTASQKSDNKYDYNIVTVVLMTEVLKLVISSVLYCKENSPLHLCSDILKNKHILVLYFVPAFLYCLYNNLAFINLSIFDPTTYYLLLQLRVVVTAIIFQVVFHKHLSRKQWFSLLVLTCGCMLKQVNFSVVLEGGGTSSKDESIAKQTSVNFGINAIFLLVQIFCSCFAGVFNESLLKKQGVDVDIYLQNIFMYLDSILANFLLMIYQGTLFEAFLFDNLIKILRWKVILVMINNAMVGIITSFFLKTLNSILKTFASALELFLTAILAYILFSIPVHLNTALAITMVLYASYLYSQNPVLNVPKKPVTEAREPLLQEDV